MEGAPQEKRKYERYATEVDVYFRVSFDIKTIVKFMVVGKDKRQEHHKKYLALSKNVSAEGLCFCAEKKLEKGDILRIEVYLPDQKNPIPMEGEVRWSMPTADASGKFNTGVRIATVNNQSVVNSIHQDDETRIVWSAVLESVFGNFRKFAQKNLKP